MTTNNNNRMEAEKLAKFLKKCEVQMKECLMPQVKTPASETHDAKCHCGEYYKEHYYELHRNNHAQNGIHSLPVNGRETSVPAHLKSSQLAAAAQKWDEKLAIDKLPTNAAGKIKFKQEEGVRRISDFVRISDDTNMSVVLELFKKHWSLFTPKPSLVISILGGVKNLKMDSKISETFKSGLIMAAKSTNAWIITGGFNAGVMKLVGDAVAEWQGVQFDDNGQPREAVRCIGIAPWGYVLNRDKLVSRDVQNLNPRASTHRKLASTLPMDEGSKVSNHRSSSRYLGGVFEYEPSTSAEHGKCLSLNPYHTHYVLVDSGKRNTFDSKVGAFRAELEKLISSKTAPLPHLDGDYYGIPVVVVLVEGGDDSIKGCSQSIEAGIPVVVCAGTGRAADILAFAIANCIRQPTQDPGAKYPIKVTFNEFALNQLKDKIYRSYYEKFLQKFFDKPIADTDPEGALLKKIKEAYKELKSDTLPRLLFMSNLPANLRKHCETAIDEIVKNVKACCVDQRLLTAFDCVSDKEDFDYAILAALANKKQTKTVEDLKEQLRLALTWNRSDIAEKDIFAHQTESFDSSELRDIIFEALIKNRVDFLNVALSNGIVINDIMNVGTLRRLYKDALADSARNTPDSNHLYRRLKNAVRKLDATIQREITHGNIRLCAIHKLISSLLGCTYVSISRSLTGDSYDEYLDVDALKQRTEYSLPSEIANLQLSNPCRELFLFAVLMNRPEMAEFFWKRTDDCLCLALMAAKIFNGLASTCEGHQLDLQNSYLASKERFEALACALCNESYKAHPERALILVERRYEIASGSNCLEMGASAQTQQFLSTTCCQDALDAHWKQVSGAVKLLRLCAQLILRQKHLPNRTGHEGIRPGAMQTFLALIFPFAIPLIDFEKPGDEDGHLSPWQKVVAFYRAPVTKFLFWHLSYLIYLLMYTYALIFDFDLTQPSIVEITIYCWTFTLFVDSLGEIGHMQGIDPRRRFNRWVRWSVWNPASLAAYVIHLAGVICRFEGKGDFTLAYRGKVLLACSLFILICRFSRAFSVHAWLGPKLVMIRKMLIELGRWMIILTIFNVAFGVLRSAIMFRGDQIANYKTFDNIIYFPFWNLWNSYDMTLNPSAGYHCEGGNVTETTGYGQICPQDFELLPIILAAYLIIAKIMLCNLNIAILNNVYGDVQQNSLQVWKYNFFLVAKWAEWKTWLPPPIGFIFHFTPYGVFGSCSSNGQEASLYLPNHIEQLRIFEREMLVSMAKTEQEAHRLTIDGQIKAVRESIAHIVDRVANLRNLDLIAKRDQEKSSTTKRAQQNWMSAMKSIARSKTGVERVRTGSAVRRVVGIPRDEVETVTLSGLTARINQMEHGFESLQATLEATLREISTVNSQS